MVLFSVNFLGGAYECFPVRVPAGAEPEQVVRLVKAMARRVCPGKTVTKIVATRTETVIWTA